MKTDSIFYRIFQQFPRCFFDLIDRPQEDPNAYEFTSVEVKQLAFRLDGLFLPRSSEISPQSTENPRPFYLVEVQFQPDDELYYRIFAELFLYLRQYQPVSPWRVVVLYPTRSIERNDGIQFQDLLNSARVTRFYLDELDPTSQPLSIQVFRLVMAPERETIATTQTMIAQAQTEIVDAAQQRAMIDLLETIVVYKLPQCSREEISQMLGLGDLKQTRFYQEAFQEGRQESKLEVLPRLIQLGLSAEAIAQALDLPLETVQDAMRSESGESS